MLASHMSLGHDELQPSPRLPTLMMARECNVYCASRRAPVRIYAECDLPTPQCRALVSPDLKRRAKRACRCRKKWQYALEGNETRASSRCSNQHWSAMHCTCTSDGTSQQCARASVPQARRQIPRCGCTLASQQSQSNNPPTPAASHSCMRQKPNIESKHGSHRQAEEQRVNVHTSSTRQPF
jgi:hypothetical protein